MSNLIKCTWGLCLLDKVAVKRDELWLVFRCQSLTAINMLISTGTKQQLILKKTGAIQTFQGGVLGNKGLFWEVCKSTTIFMSLERVAGDGCPFFMKNGGIDLERWHIMCGGIRLPCSLVNKCLDIWGCF